MSKLKELLLALLITAMMSGQVTAQSKTDDEPCIECAVVGIAAAVIVGTVLDFMFGGSSNSSNGRQCDGRLIPSPEGGMMPADPDCQ